MTDFTVRPQATRITSDPILPTSPQGRVIWGGAMLGAAAAVLIAPVLSFVVLLAGFGLAHVLAELRYVDRRFLVKGKRPLIGAILMGVAAIAFVRMATMGGLLAWSWAVALEVALGIALSVLAAMMVERARLLVGSAILAFAALAYASPLHALLLLALLHNLTPLGFIAEATPQEQRAKILSSLAVPFLILPLLIASGLPGWALAQWGWEASLWTPPEAGPLQKHLAAFLPPGFWDHPRALDVFAGAVFAQAMHYVAVIIVMPRLQAMAGDEEGLAPWPQGIGFWIGVALATTLLLTLYAIDYGQARALYSLMAAIHSWLEVPILILALGAPAGLLKP